MTSPVSQITQGIHHLGLTVPDISRTKDFFLQYLNFTVIGENPGYPAVFLGDGTVMLTLWQAENPQEANPFDRHHNIGLHHFALKMVSKAALEELYSRLKDVDDVTIEFAPEPVGGSEVTHMMCIIPGGIRTEFIAP